MSGVERPKEFVLRFSDMTDHGLNRKEQTALTEMVANRDTAVRSDERERIARAFEGKGGNVWGLELRVSYDAVAEFIRGLR